MIQFTGHGLCDYGRELTTENDKLRTSLKLFQLPFATTLEIAEFFFLLRKCSTVLLPKKALLAVRVISFISSATAG
jgi:hypothetical protein